MSQLQFTFLGTGSSSQLPVFRCDCPACERAREDAFFVRRPCSAMLSSEKQMWLIDSGLTDLAARFEQENIRGILQTHYHADHVQGLLHLRWGRGDTIPVYGPHDEVGFADLYKHPGILDFQKGWEAFECKDFGAFTATALPLQHSRPTMGYLISARENIAYLTDTCGLSNEVLCFLQKVPLKYVVLDCSYPPLPNPRQHNDLTTALALIEVLKPQHGFLTHIDHKLDCYLMEHPQALSENVFLARDNLVLEI